MLHEWVRSVRRNTAPTRHWVAARLDPRRIQRTVRLRREDFTSKRRRYHVLVDLVNEHCPGTDLRIGEVGACTGITSAHLIKYCPQISRIYAVDIQKPDPNNEYIADLEQVTFIQGRSDECAREVEDGSLDLVFIDADHSEESVLRDLEAWVPKVKPGRVIAGHDYGSHNHQGVKAAVDLFFSQHPHPISVETNRVWWTLS